MNLKDLNSAQIIGLKKCYSRRQETSSSSSSASKLRIPRKQQTATTTTTTTTGDKYKVQTENGDIDGGQPSSNSNISSLPQCDQEEQQQRQQLRQQTTISETKRKLKKLKIYYVDHGRKLLKLKKICLDRRKEASSLSGLSIDQTKIDLKRDEGQEAVAAAAANDNLDTLEKIAKLIEAKLEQHRRTRPKRLLLFVNPYGGKGRAVQVFKRCVRRLLSLAQCDYELVVTQYANHARETLEDPQFDLTRFDGIVCIGGDGMFAELMNGLLFRHNNELLQMTNDNDKRQEMSLKDNGFKQLTVKTKTTTTTTTTTSAGDDNNEVELLRARLGGLGRRFVSPRLPVGVIGAGSTDANLFGFTGTNDATTAVLNIILGKQINIDVCSIHSYADDRLLRFVSTFVAYGYFGDVVRESEQLRWLGPSRYDLSAVNNLIKYRAYDGLVRIWRSREDGEPQDLEQRCGAHCRVCSSTSLSPNTNKQQHQHQQQQHQTDLDKLELIETRGPFVGVNAAVTACRCPQTRKGFSPSNHLANGCADVILVKPCSRLQYVNYLIRTGYTKKSAFDLKYVDAYRCRQFEFLAGAAGAAASKQNSSKRIGKNSSADEDFASTISSRDESSGLGSFTTTTTTTGSEKSNSLDSQDKKSKLVKTATATMTSSSNGKQQQQQQQNKEAAATSSSSSSSSSSSMSLSTTTTTAATITNNGNASSWNADGEVLQEQSIRVKVNRRLLRVFGTGEPDRRADELEDFVHVR